MNPLTPRCFGKYEILEKLGSGAMGVVYLAYDPVIARRVAVKTIHRHAFDEISDAAERFRREASAAGRLTHPGIVAVYDYGEEDSVAYIVMEYAPGLELDAYVAEHRPSLQQIGRLMGELLDALGYAHAAGVVHRDVKPANILVSERLKVTDFGVARITTTSGTETGVAVGTPIYMPPEQFTGKGVDHRSDLFAAGVIFYELVTGRRPFDGDSLEELSYKICHTQPPGASTLNARLPKSLDAVLERALAKSKNERFASAADFWRAASEALSLGELQASGLRPSVAGNRVAEGRVTGGDFSGSSVAGSNKSSWGADVTSQLEGILVPVLGSVARVVVRRSTSRTESAAELLRLLAESIEREPGRGALLARLRTVLGEPEHALHPHAEEEEEEEPISVAPEAIARVSLALANWLGPIARVMTKKAAVESTSYLDLCLRLSERLSTPEEKAAFLKQVGVA